MDYSVVTAGVVLVFLYVIEGIFPSRRVSTRRFGHAARNLCLAGANALVVGLGFTGLTRTVGELVADRGWGALNVAGLPPPLEALAAMILFDVWMYIWHRMNHELGIFWLFHRMHHTDPAMDTTTAIRFHPGEMILSSLFNLGILVILGLRLEYLALYKGLLTISILFHHSNIALPEHIDRRLRAIIVTPHMHRVHHSNHTRDTNSNYSSVLSVWDRLIRTYRRRDTHTITFGVEGVEPSRWNTVIGMVVTPFRKLKY